MENRGVIGTVEKITLGEVEFMEDSLEIWVGIKEVSENLQGKILQAVEEEKVRTTDTMQALYGRGWNETTVTDLTLHVVARKGKSLETNISVFFEEVEDPNIFESGRLGIDLSDYEMELKGLIVKAITTKFF